MEDSPRRLKALGSVPDVVFGILKEHGSPMHHAEITQRIVSMLPDGAEPDPKLIARVHTDINLDSRFYHVGNGMWGLREWAPKRMLQQKTTPGWQPRGAGGGKAKRGDAWRGGDDDSDEHEQAKADEDESEWPRDSEDDPDRPEAW